MAYGIKFRFRFESCHGTTYEVRLCENGYSGPVTDRPLGKTPVLRMQDGFPFRATSCDLVLECQVEGEYVDLYTTDPNQYKVEIYRKGGSNYSLIWYGFVATEIYSEPDIAPPYDVRITATDGLGILKEHTFEGAGLQSIRKHLQDLLTKTGDTQPYLYTATQLRDSSGTAAGFMDDAEINMDYLIGKSCYDVLSELLTSLRCCITRYFGSTLQAPVWLVVREADVWQLTPPGILQAVFSDSDPSAASLASFVYCGGAVGQMGAAGADFWPNGYLTRRVVPAKKSVKVRSDWNLRNGFPAIGSWRAYGEAVVGSLSASLGYLGGTGGIYGSMAMTQFTYDIKVSLRAARGSVWQNYNGEPYVKVLAMYLSSGGGGTKYYHPDTGWTTTSPSTGDSHAVERSYFADPNDAETVEVTIPCPNDSYGGSLTVYAEGHLVALYGVTVEILTIKGYEDTITIDNDARGSAEDLSITGGRQTSTFSIWGGFVYGVWSSATTRNFITDFSDGSSSNKDFMSLTALAYAKEHAAPRIEITGKIDTVYDDSRRMPPLFIQSHGVWAMLSRYDWDMLNEDVDFTAVTLPTAVLEVDSETITTIPD